MAMVHLTLTGAYAGAPICGCDKRAEAESGARFVHAMWAPAMVMLDTELCSRCKAEWDAAGANVGDEAVQDIAEMLAAGM